MKTTPLAAWLAFVLVFSGISYASRFSGGKPAKDVLYHWGTLGEGLFEYALIGLIVYGIAGLGDRRELFALRRPTSWGLATAIGIGIAIGMVVLTAALGPVLNPGREQGLTPTGWEPSHAGPYIANGLVITVVAPFVEELTFRGVGFSLLRPFGAWTAIILVGVLFGAAHGLVEAFPFLAAFGAGLAYLRYRVDSVVPGMIVHGLFNAASLTLAVVH